jgi:regulator of RNase E activity RraA
MALPAGLYSVTIYSGDVAYADSTLTGVVVVAPQNINIGTIVPRQW